MEVYTWMYDDRQLISSVVFSNLFWGMTPPTPTPTHIFF